MHTLYRLAARLRLAVDGLLQRATARVADAAGQTTAEYALVILGAAAVGTLLIAWATKSHGISRLFDAVIEKAIP